MLLSCVLKMTTFLLYTFYHIKSHFILVNAVASGGRSSVSSFTAEEMLFQVTWPWKCRLRIQTWDLDPQTVGVLGSTLPSLLSLLVTLFSLCWELASIGEGRTFLPLSFSLETKAHLMGPDVALLVWAATTHCWFLQSLLLIKLRPPTSALYVLPLQQPPSSPKPPRMVFGI